MLVTISCPGYGGSYRESDKEYIGYCEICTMTFRIETSGSDVYFSNDEYDLHPPKGER